jgi:hypothetical protein
MSLPHVGRAINLSQSPDHDPLDHAIAVDEVLWPRRPSVNAGERFE